MKTFKYSYVIVAVVFSGFFIGCERDTSQSVSEMRDLLTSTVWGDETICGYIADPESDTRIFEQGGRYLEFSKIFQNLYNATWVLKDNNTLIFLNDEYKIVKLNENNLEIRSVFCVSRFKALKQVKVITLGVTAISVSSARLHGSVRTGETAEITFEYGISSEYGNVLIPEINKITKPSNTIVSVNLTGLVPETVYHFRIKVVSTSGTYYGDDQTFRTHNTLTLTDADNNIYNTTTIGSQVWITENLKTTRYNDGTAIPLAEGNTSWSGLSTPGYCWYENDPSANKDIYGALFNWYTVNSGKLCPAGWHVPSEQEWTSLFQFLGQQSGSRLTEGGYDLPTPILYSDPLATEDASNGSGFSAKWSGTRSANSSFYTSRCTLWSRTENASQNSLYVLISESQSLLMTGEKGSGLPVRCLKD